MERRNSSRKEGGKSMTHNQWKSMTHNQCFWSGSRLMRNYIELFYKFTTYLYISLSKTTTHVFLTPTKDVQAHQTWKFYIFFLFWGTITACLDPETQSGSEDPIESGSNPDSKNCPVSSGSTGSACFWPPGSGSKTISQRDGSGSGSGSFPFFIRGGGVELGIPILTFFDKM